MHPIGKSKAVLCIHTQFLNICQKCYKAHRKTEKKWANIAEVHFKVFGGKHPENKDASEMDLSKFPVFTETDLVKENNLFSKNAFI